MSVEEPKRRGEIPLSESSAQWFHDHWSSAAQKLTFNVELGRISENEIRAERDAAIEVINALADVGVTFPGSDIFFGARAAALTCDPTDRFEWSYLFGMAIQNKIDLFNYNALAALLIGSLANGTASDVKALFEAAIRAKQESEKTLHRNAWAFKAFLSFMEETHRVPSKPQLRDYIDARREIYKDAPSMGDLKGWTRVWKASKLYNLDDYSPPSRTPK